MGPRLKKFLKILAVLAVLAVGSAILIAYVTEDRIRDLAVSQLNSALETEVSVDKISFSLLRKFPSASIEFRNIAIAEKSDRKDKEKLLEASSVFLEFDPFDLITGTYVIDRIEVVEGTVRISYFEDGTENFRFFKSDSSGEDFKISLTRLRFRDSKLIYRNLKTGDKMDARLSDFELHGDITSDHYEMNISSKGNFDSMRFGSFHLKKPYDYSLKLLLEVDETKDKYSFNTASVQLGQLAFGVDGYIRNLENGMETDLSFIGQNTKLNYLKDFLPATWSEKLDEFDASGTLDIKGTVSGLSTDRENPAVDLKIFLEKGRLKQARSGMKLRDIYLSGIFSNGRLRSDKTSYFQIDSLYFLGETGATYGSLKIQNFDDLQLRFQVHSQFRLESLKDIIANDSIEEMKGNCMLSLSMQGDLDSLSSITARDIKKAEMRGRATLDGVAFKYHGMPRVIENMKGGLSFRSNLISLDSLGLSIGGNDIQLSGQVHNLIPYLFYEDEKLSVRAEVSSPFLNIDEMLSGSSGNGGGLALPVSGNLDLQLVIEAGDFEFRKFKATDLRADLHSRYPVLNLEHLSFNSMQGTYKGWISMKLQGDGQTYLKSELDLEDVNVQELFAQFENFGQKAIVSENLKGKANIKLAYESMFDREFNLIPPTVKVRSTVEIINGELIDYEPILALSKYVEVDELKHIKFNRLYNEIEILNEVVIIPQMEINSSALELGLSGRHSFSNEIEYHFQLNLNDFLFKKAKRSKKNQTEFGEIEADESGRAKLFIRMEGTVDDYKIRLDRKALRNKWSEDLSEERRELKDLFRQEFTKEERKEKIEPMNFGIEWDGQESGAKPEKVDEKPVEENKSEVNDVEKKKGKKSLLDKLGGENKDEYESYDAEKYD